MRLRLAITVRAQTLSRCASPVFPPCRATKQLRLCFSHLPCMSRGCCVRLSTLCGRRGCLHNWYICMHDRRTAATSAEQRLIANHLQPFQVSLQPRPCAATLLQRLVTNPRALVRPELPSAGTACTGRKRHALCGGHRIAGLLARRRCSVGSGLRARAGLSLVPTDRQRAALCSVGFETATRERLQAYVGQLLGQSPWNIMGVYPARNADRRRGSTSGVCGTCCMPHLAVAGSPHCAVSYFVEATAGCHNMRGT
jgi:hypothetical protein